MNRRDRANRTIDAIMRKRRIVKILFGQIDFILIVPRRPEWSKLGGLSRLTKAELMQLCETHQVPYKVSMTEDQFRNILFCRGRIEYREQLQGLCVRSGIPFETKSSTKSVLAKLHQATPARSWRHDPNSGCDRRADPASVGGASSSIRGLPTTKAVFVDEWVKAD